MTNKEAIELLCSFRICVAPTLSEAMSVAISALQAQEKAQEVSNDSPELDKENGELISRDVALEACYNGWNKDYREIAQDIKDLPSAQADSKELSFTHKAPDTISREAAIDALRTCYDTETVTMSNGDEYINYEDAVGEIEELPPTQPEIVRCRECVYASKDDYARCPYVTWWNGKDDFCSKGKRRTDE